MNNRCLQLVFWMLFQHHYIYEYKIKMFLLSLPSFLLKSFHEIRKNMSAMVCTVFRWKCNNNNILMCQTINSKWIGRIVQMGVWDLFISQFPYQLKVTRYCCTFVFVVIFLFNVISNNPINWLKYFLSIFRLTPWKCYFFYKKFYHKIT